MFHPASASSVFVFLLVCGVVVFSFLRGVWIGARAQRRDPLRVTLLVSAGLLLWLATIAELVGSGWLEAVPGRLLALGAVVMGGSALLGLSPLGGWLANSCPISLLLAFQGFRLPLELVLHSWVRQGVIPGTMTWTGSNWDVLSGAAALGLAPLSRHSKAAAWAGNIIGFVLLLNVGRVAVFSAPLSFGWHDVTPKLLLPYYLPYALVIPVCVGGALAGHIILTRALLRPNVPSSLRAEDAREAGIRLGLTNLGSRLPSRNPIGGGLERHRQSKISSDEKV